MFGGRQLEDDASLASAGVTDESTHLHSHALAWWSQEA